MGSDRTILIDALAAAATRFRAQNPLPTLLSGPNASVLAPLADEIARCASYQEVAGHALFNGGSGVVLHTEVLAERLFAKGVWPTQNIEGSVDWLLQILNMREAVMLLKVALWGIKIEEPVQINANAKLTPFAAIDDSFLKGRLVERSRTLYDQTIWRSPTYHDVPETAYVETVPHFPCIGSKSFESMRNLYEKTGNLVSLLQASTGTEIVGACWLEYRNPDLEFSSVNSSFFWLLPEVHPRVRQTVVADPQLILTNIAHFGDLPGKRKDNVLRSMHRFRLSQSREQTADQILDLTLAFEIAVSGGGEKTTPSFKVSVRTAQAIGGALSERKSTRERIAELYTLRNTAAHGGRLRNANALVLIKDACHLYVRLMTKLLTLKSEPCWGDIELEPLP